MQSVSPVLTEKEVEFEVVVALGQKEYLPIIVAPVQFADDIKGAVVRFEFSSEERKAIAEGADLVITEILSGYKFTPLNLCLVQRGVYPFDAEE